MTPGTHRTLILMLAASAACSPAASTLDDPPVVDDTPAAPDPFPCALNPGGWSTCTLNPADFDAPLAHPDFELMPLETVADAVLTDLDGDGRDDDLLYGEFPVGDSVALCADGGAWRRCDWQPPTDLHGFRGAAAEDLDGDGLRDLVVVAPAATRAVLEDWLATMEELHLAAIEAGEDVLVDGPEPEQGGVVVEGALILRLRVFLGQPGGGFMEAPDALGMGAPFNQEGCWTGGLDVFDIDGDGVSEVHVRRKPPCATTSYQRGTDGRWRKQQLLPTAAGYLALLTLPPVDGVRDVIMPWFGFYRQYSAHGYFSHWKGAPGAWVAVDDQLEASLARADVMGGSLGDPRSVGALDLLASDIGGEILLQSDPSGPFGIDAWRADEASGMRTMTPTGVPVTWGTRWVDLEGDGDADAVLTSCFDHLGIAPYDQSLRVWRNRGDGFFELDADPDFTAPAHERGLIVADLDHNGCPDLITLPTYGGPHPRAAAKLRMNDSCAPGGQTVRFETAAGHAANQVAVTFERPGGAVQAWHVEATGGTAGWSVPELWPTADVSALTVRWNDGSEDRYEAPFPAVIRPR